MDHGDERLAAAAGLDWLAFKAGFDALYAPLNAFNVMLIAHPPAGGG
ncbi:MAG: hypothetical protein IH926_12780 [Proteobacteria bacterium]|nr:hypothetical protein [Pseudomonadota bacterium]